MSPTQLIDDKGVIWPADSFELRRRVFLNDVAGQISDFVVQHLGFVKISTAPCATAVTVRSDITSNPSLSALYRELLIRGSSRVLLRDLRVQSPAVIVGTAIAAIRRIQESVQASRIESEAALSATTIAIPPTTPPGAILQYWRESTDRTRVDFIEDVSLRMNLGRYTVIENCPSGFGTRFRMASNGLIFPDPKWNKHLNGLLTYRMPDRRYGEWVSAAYKRALLARRPLVEHIVAPMFWPGSGYVTKSYVRLLLPVQDSHGTTLLFGLSCTPAEAALSSAVT